MARAEALAKAEKKAVVVPHEKRVTVGNVDFPDIIGFGMSNPGLTVGQLVIQSCDTTSGNYKFIDDIFLEEIGNTLYLCLKVSAGPTGKTFHIPFNRIEYVLFRDTNINNPKPVSLNGKTVIS